MENFEVFLKKRFMLEEREKSVGANIQTNVPYLGTLSRDDHLQLFILYKLLETLRLHAIESPNLESDNRTEIESVLFMLKQMTIVSFDTSQDVFTLASYTIRLMYGYSSNTLFLPMDTLQSSIIMEDTFNKCELAFLDGSETVNKRYLSSQLSCDNGEQRLPSSRKRKIHDISCQGERTERISSIASDESSFENVIHELQSVSPTNWRLKIWYLVVESLTALSIPSSPNHHGFKRLPDGLERPIDHTAVEEITSAPNAILHSINQLAQALPHRYHTHLAIVLCRVAIPYCSNLVSYFPLSATSFVRGCVDVFQLSCHRQLSSKDPMFSVIKNIAKDSVKRIACISSQESSQVMSILRQHKIMPDIFLPLLLQENRGIEHTILSELLQSFYESSVGYDQRACDRHGKLLPMNYRGSRVNAWNDGTWIQQHLHQNQNMTQDILMRLSGDLTNLTASGRNFSRGHACLTVHTMALLLVNSDMHLDQSSLSLVNLTVDALAKATQMYPRISIMENLASSLDGNLPFSSVDDDFLKLSFCLCILLSITLFLSCPTDILLLSPCQTCFESVLQAHVSTRFAVFTHHVFDALNNQQENDFQLLLTNTVRCPRISFNTEIFSLFCQWSRLMRRLYVREIVDLPMPEGENRRAQNILTDPQQCMDVIMGRHTLSMCNYGEILGTMSGQPSVLPFQVEKLERTLGLHLNSTSPQMATHIVKNINIYHCQYLFQVIYSLLFLDKSPSSLFTIDPRMIHLDSALSIAEALFYQRETSDHDLLFLLFTLVAKHCPDCVFSWKFSQYRFRRVHEATSQMNIDCKSLASSIVNFFESKTFDVNLYILSQIHLPDIDTKIVETITEFVEKRRIFVSFKSLCEDPLQLFKFPLALWKSPRFRNILLSILQRIFVINDVLCIRCPSLEVVAELLQVRDIITVKCLLTIYDHLKLSRTNDCCLSRVTDQEMLLSSIRWIFAQRRTLVSSFGQVSSDSVELMLLEIIHGHGRTHN